MKEKKDDDEEDKEEEKDEETSHMMWLKSANTKNICLDFWIEFHSRESWESWEDENHCVISETWIALILFTF